MGSFELLEHTADAKFRAYGATREDAFAQVVPALAMIAAGTEVGTHRSRQVNVTGADLHALLFSFIDELIFLVDTEDFLAQRATALAIEGAGPWTLTATLLGDDASRYGGNLKAATYSDMKIDETDAGWLLEAVVDI